MKRYLFCYDISDDKIRNEVIKILKRNGFYRIQRSVFLGYTTIGRISEIIQYLRSLKDLEECKFDSYLMIPLEERSVEEMRDLNDKSELNTMLPLYLGKKVVFLFG